MPVLAKRDGETRGPNSHPCRPLEMDSLPASPTDVRPSTARVPDLHLPLPHALPWPRPQGNEASVLKQKRSKKGLSHWNNALLSLRPTQRRAARCEGVTQAPFLRSRFGKNLEEGGCSKGKQEKWKIPFPTFPPGPPLSFLFSVFPSSRSLPLT